MSTLCREVGTVLNLTERGEAVVQVKRAEACQACAARGACQTLGGSVRDFDVVVENRLGAGPGDRVVLSLSEASLVTASAVLYLLPAFLLVLGALGGAFFGPALGFETDPSSIVGSLLGLATGLGVAKLVGNQIGNNKRYVPELTSIERRVEVADAE